MKLTVLEKNLLDINNDAIPKIVMDKFWELKEVLGTKPLGIARIDSVFYIICPALEEYILTQIDMTTWMEK